MRLAIPSAAGKAGAAAAVRAATVAMKLLMVPLQPEATVRPTKKGRARTVKVGWLGGQNPKERKNT